ncbi:hypothetical protein R69608_06921 [Paraburkholderia nemoris]|nr:hypothetical protein R69608_06921 [Paraburkholderia nemoris]
MKHVAQTAVRPVISIDTMHARRRADGCRNPRRRFIIDRQALFLRAQLRRSHPVPQSEPAEAVSAAARVAVPQSLTDVQANPIPVSRRRRISRGPSNSSGIGGQRLGHRLRALTSLGSQHSMHGSSQREPLLSLTALVSAPLRVDHWRPAGPKRSMTKSRCSFFCTLPRRSCMPRLRLL